jgi:hypothetical protein
VIRAFSVVSAVLLASCVQINRIELLAADVLKPKSKARRTARTSLAPTLPTTVATTLESMDASEAGTRADTITEYRNELGQTVYSVTASHFDISPPLRELATAAGTAQASENEPPAHPHLTATRLLRSNVPDPVVQIVIPPADPGASGNLPLGVPTTGFNFLGMGNYRAPGASDSNGSVGNDQFVETINVRYQVWSLDRATKVATSILGPVDINTLWAGFGGACEALNDGDPIVLFDKTAKRWLISQFTIHEMNGRYYQCVALSSTADATGAYARYAFVVPGGPFGDYPHFGVWTDAYYMMAEGVGGLFAAMDRAKMLAGNPAATWQVIVDTGERGHMPADLDGFALPPSKAPGIFVSLHGTGMYVYRMKVNFSVPSATVRTLQAVVPVAPATDACDENRFCIPQPGTENTVDSIGDRLMFRAAYRNFVDHESLVVSHSVDPAVTGVVSGVRWYDLRLSGNPDATCPTYPCIHQQGTIADVADGRSRWLPSIAMDTAENILVGYNTTGKADGSENHSSRYTGRAKSDPFGTMTAPETTIVNGTANSVGTIRWGDYSSMSVDPFDDCTFWYVSQYYAVQDIFSTRIASARFPSGSGAGECPATTCNARPTFTPANGSATVPGDNQITVTWTAAAPTPGAYAIERAEGACGTEGLYRPLAAVEGTATSFTDTTVMGGISYSYRVRVAADPAGKCQAQLASLCVSATATGTCSFPPETGGLSVAADKETATWSPTAFATRYDVVRGSLGALPSGPGGGDEACFNDLPGPSFADPSVPAVGTGFWYVSRGENSCGNGSFGQQSDGTARGTTTCP